MKRDEFIKKLHPAITHVSASDTMSEETVNAINIMVDKVLQMSPEERRVFAKSELENRVTSGKEKKEG